MERERPDLDLYDQLIEKIRQSDKEVKEKVARDSKELKEAIEEKIRR